MELQELLRSVSDAVSGTATVKNVYGEPIVAADRTVIPIARVKYAFGGGGGKSGSGTHSGGGAGARVSVTPCGALEIGPEGTRFVPLHVHGQTLAALAIGFVLGALVVGLGIRPDA